MQNIVSNQNIPSWESIRGQLEKRLTPGERRVLDLFLGSPVPKSDEKEDISSSEAYRDLQAQLYDERAARQRAEAEVSRLNRIIVRQLGLNLADLPRD